MNEDQNVVLTLKEAIHLLSKIPVNEIHLPSIVKKITNSNLEEDLLSKYPSVVNEYKTIVNDNVKRSKVIKRLISC